MGFLLSLVFSITVRKKFAGEAAGALGGSTDPEAVAILKKYWDVWIEPDLKRALLFSLAASPLLEAAEFLLSVVPDAPERIAADAIRALASSRYRSEIRERAAKMVARRNESSLKELFNQEFAD